MTEESLDDIEREAGQAEAGERVHVDDTGEGAQGEHLGPGPEDLAELPTWQMIDQLLAPLCAVWCPAWQITTPERKAVSQAWGTVIDKWFPEGPPIGPEISAVLITLSVFGSRAGYPRKYVQDSGTGAGTEAPRDENGEVDYSQQF